MIVRPSLIEPLESRIAPATLIDPRTIIFKDIDGDDVTIKFSRDVFTGDATAQLARANQVFTFDTGSIDGTPATDPVAQQLRLVDLTKFPISATLGSTANGAGFTITAVQKGAGDGLVDVGAIKATGVSVGVAVIDGDLGQIDAGGSGLRVGLAGLTVNSLGLRGVATQIPVPNPTATNPAPDLISTITGELTALTVLTDLKDAQVKVIDGKNSSDQVTTAAKLSRLTVGGKIYSTASADDSGSVECGRAIGTVTLGNLFGGAGKNSGRISALQGGITTITITGDLSGGAGFGAGQVFAFGSIGTLTIGDDLIGGSGEGSGVVRTFGAISSVTIGDDIIADTGVGSATISSLGAISRLLIKGDIDGTTTAAGTHSASIYAGAGLPSAMIKGNIFGGSGVQTAVIESGRTIGTLVVEKSIVGGGGDGSGGIVAQGAITSLTVKMDLTGGAGRQSGTVLSGVDALIRGDLGTVLVSGKVTGGIGVGSGAIVSGGAIKTVTVGTLPLVVGTPLVDVLIGGQGNGSGAISALGAITTLKVNGHVLGGLGTESGSVTASDRVNGFDQFAGNLGTATIAGHIFGGEGSRSGSVLIDGKLTTLAVGGIRGGAGAGSGNVRVGDGSVVPGDAGTIKITGDFVRSAVPGVDSASIVTSGKLGTLTVTGMTDGAKVRIGLNSTAITMTGNVSNTLVTALGQAVQGATVDLAFAKLTFGGNVTASSFLAGYDLSGAAANPDAQIGAVTVRHDWTASNLVAGVAAGVDAGFGNAGDGVAPGLDNPAIVSRIASIVIGGAAAGSGVDGEHFGFVAQLVRAAKVGPTVFALDALANGQTFDVGGASSGVSIVEVAVPVV
ncbi:MAG: hypothetical protein WCF18_07965 [Chthoniobacteraceae bacterium]